MKEAVEQRDLHLRNAEMYLQEGNYESAMREYAHAAETDGLLAQILVEADGAEADADIYMLSSIESWMRTLVVKLFVTGRKPSDVAAFNPPVLQNVFEAMFTEFVAKQRLHITRLSEAPLNCQWQEAPMFVDPTPVPG